jgi:ABC-type amino acid transport substrate-binding protein
MYLATTALVASVVAIAWAQTNLPYVPPDQLDERRRLSQTDIRFCVWGDSPLSEFESHLATEIAHALLLEPIITVMFRPPATNDADFWETTYRILTNDCEALMGFIIVPEQQPEWMIVSRPYLEMETVLAVRDSAIRSLEDVPPGAFVGSLIATFGDFQLMNYIRTQPQDRAWRRLPYDSAQHMVQRLLDGTLAAALVPAAELYGVQRVGPEAHSVTIASTSPLSVATTLFAIGMRSSETSLRLILDEAILALLQDGTVHELIQELGLPGRPGSTSR